MSKPTTAGAALDDRRHDPADLAVHVTFGVPANGGVR